MNVSKILAIVLIAAGALGLAYGGFTYTETTHAVDLGPLQLTVDEPRHVRVPLWAGLVAIGAGTALLLSARRS